MNHWNQSSRVVVTFAFVAVVTTFQSQRLFSASPQFEIRLLTVDANEGIAAGDVDGDGTLDLVAGRNWYRGGEWVPRPVRNIEDWNGYVQSNGDYLWDIDGDGWLDVFASGFLSTKIQWFRNPGSEALQLGKRWEGSLLVDTGMSKNEGQILEDLDGDGQPEYIVNSWQKDVPMMVWRFDSADSAQESQSIYQLIPHQLGDAGNGHGVGAGDLSGDGKADVLVGQGWYEQPKSDPWNQPWTFHGDWLLHASLPILVVDLDQDEDNDLIFGNGHDFGLQWWENRGFDDEGKLTWSEHLIDREFSQPHSMLWTDLNGDGNADLITGKRVFAHNGRDPGGQQPPCLYWYQWNASDKTFTRHVIDEGRVGTGLQIVAADFNADGHMDLATAGKSGTYLLLAEPTNSTQLTAIP
ncbi:MAG: VCBS repeat-containing protein [Planctomycetota bacterium]